MPIFKFRKYTLVSARLQTNFWRWFPLIKAVFSPPSFRSSMRSFLMPLAGLCAVLGCDHGLVPPDRDAVGDLYGTVTYTGTWPGPDSLFDLRFVGMRFVPRDTSDFLQLNRMVISPGLKRNVGQDTFLIEGIDVGVLVYNGIAEKFGPGILDWRPAALFTEGDGTIEIEQGRRTEIALHVDFAVRPPFPPSAAP